MSQERFWILFSKKLSGEASAGELSELESLINNHPEWQYAIQNLGDLWATEPSREITHEDEDAYLVHLQNFKEKLGFDSETGDPGEEPGDNRKNKRGILSFIAIKWVAAAAFVGVIFLSLVLFKKQGAAKMVSGAGDMSEISTRLGSKSKVQLPDGSVIWLNAGSKLTYDKDFNKELREVTLIGEGFFDVTKNKEKPFIIHTTAIDIKVLGTAFNVRAYPEDNITETSLIRGSIEVSVKNRPDDKIILSPNEKLVVMNKDAEVARISGKREEIKPEISVQQLKYNLADSTIAETQWVENKLVFRDEDFNELARRLERWYNVLIIIKDKDLEDIRFSGTFSNETVEEALQALKISAGFQYKINNDTIIIYK